MNSPVEQIKERLNIVDVVSSYVKLEKSGIHFRARCPFHNEKTPSFFVSPERNNYHCFGCGKGGDIFSFVQEIEGLTFPETIKVLADKAGIVLSKYEKQQEDDDSVLYKALSLSAKYFEAVLKKFPSGVEYLKARGITDETIANFAVGYAPDGWRNLSSFLTSRGIPEEVQERAGLVIKSERGHYDRFRGRIMFPICNATGKVVGFSGRIFPEKLDEPMSAKYVNSPETKVYNKSRILFGYDKAKRAIAKTGRAIIVEGQMDLN
jgi:DNA primase